MTNEYAKRIYTPGAEDILLSFVGRMGRKIPVEVNGRVSMLKPKLIGGVWYVKPAKRGYTPVECIQHWRDRGDGTKDTFSTYFVEG